MPNITSLKDFLEKIQEYKKGKNKVWYRGHGEYNYKLEPSVYRPPYSPSNEEELMDQFKSRAIPYLKTVPQNNEYWEWLFLMQHYKMPTRLLDWTESPLIALAFAVIYRDKKTREKGKEGAHVWCLDPLALNDNFNPIANKPIPNITENIHAKEICKKEYKQAMGNINLPVAVYGPQNNPRIVGQKGVFSVFPANEKFAFDDTIKNLGIKLIMETDAVVEKIRSELFDIGVSESMIYPELDSISREICREFETKNTVKKAAAKKASAKKVAKKSINR